MSNPDSDLHLQFSITPILQHHDVVSPSSAANNPRKKRRSKVMRLENPKSSPSPRNGAVSAPKKPENRPEITMPCSECGKRFWSWKALFGHMRCHPERQWRGINPPPNLLRRRSDHLALMIGWSEEETDVAACLLLLANGQPKTSEIAEARQEDVDHDQDQQIIHGHGGGVGGGSCRFECSSCKKVFGSRQALGGHRASHKNVKGCFAMARRIDAGGDGRQRDQNLVVLEAERNIFSMELGSSSSSLHKCGICLRIFSSGQALGGHMRCHWEKLGITSDDPPLMSQALNYSFSGLDLNLPAPVEDRDISSSSDLSASSSAMALDLRLGL